MAADKQSQMRVAERLQELILERFEELLAAKEETQTDRATIVKLLSANGWDLDPENLPSNLADYVTKRVNPRDFDEDE
jgi:hypothetical protein